MSQMLKGLEQQAQDAKVLIENHDAAVRLSNNPDFRKLIINGFCGTDAARMVQASGDPALGEAERADSLAMAQASGHLKRWLQMQIQMAQVAIRQGPELEQAIAEERAREDAGDAEDVENHN